MEKKRREPNDKVEIGIFGSKRSLPVALFLFISGPTHSPSSPAQSPAFRNSNLNPT